MTRKFSLFANGGSSVSHGEVPATHDKAINLICRVTESLLDIR
jgi:hypothetical protein